MRVIDGPEPISIVLDGRGTTISFKDFLKTALEQFEPAGKGLRNIRQANKIMTAIEAMEGSNLSLESEDFNVLKGAVEAASWRPAAARSFIPFYDAMENATSYDPEKVKK